MHSFASSEKRKSAAKLRFLHLLRYSKHPGAMCPAALDTFEVIYYDGHSHVPA